MTSHATAALLCAALIVSLSGATAAVGETGGNQAGGSAVTAKKKCKKGAAASRKKCKKRTPAPLPPATTPPVVTPPGPAPASLSISPTSFNFGDVLSGPGGFDSPNQTFTVTNTGGSLSGTLASSLGGTDPGNYEISSDACNGVALGAGSSCTLDVRCRATGGLLGIKTATLTVSGSPGGSASASLTCNETT